MVVESLAAVFGDMAFELQPRLLGNDTSGFSRVQKFLVSRLRDNAHSLTKYLHHAAISRGVGIVLAPKTTFFIAGVIRDADWTETACCCFDSLCTPFHKCKANPAEHASEKCF
jgi:hypothetical protein